MGVTNQPRLNFVGVDISSIHVEVQNQYTNAEIKHSILPKIILPKNLPDNFKVVMDVHIESEGYFNIKTIISGLFILNMEMEDKHRDTFMHLNAPAILFPYVRSFISTLTSNLGSSMGTIIIPPRYLKGK